MKIVAQTLSISCNCGGDMLDSDKSSYMITSDTTIVVCDTCEKQYDMRKLPATRKASIFS